MSLVIISRPGKPELFFWMVGKGAQGNGDPHILRPAPTELGGTFFERSAGGNDVIDHKEFPLISAGGMKQTDRCRIDTPIRRGQLLLHTTAMAAEKWPEFCSGEASTQLGQPPGLIKSVTRISCRGAGRIGNRPRADIFSLGEKLLQDHPGQIPGQYVSGGVIGVLLQGKDQTG